MTTSLISVIVLYLMIVALCLPIIGYVVYYLTRIAVRAYIDALRSSTKGK